MHRTPSILLGTPSIPLGLGLTLSLGLTVALLANAALAATQKTALYLDRVVALEPTLEDPTDLWVKPDGLTAVNDFVLKPEGACLGDLCIPLEQSVDNDVVVKRQGETWLSLTGFARKVGQPYAADYETQVWSFGAIPATRSAFLDSALAPDFALPDRQGKLVRLSDFRGHRVLILTWASW